MSMNEVKYTVVSTSYCQGHVSAGAFGLYGNKTEAAKRLKHEVLIDLSQQFELEDEDMDDLINDHSRVEYHSINDDPGQWDWCQYADDDGLIIVWSVCGMKTED